MSVMQTGRTRRWLAAGLAATGLTLLAACGSTAQAASTTDGTAAAAANGDMEAFTTCLAKNGVTLPEPPNGGGTPGGAPPAGGPQGAPPDAAGGTPPAPEGVDENTWNAAMEACKDLRPTPPAARS